MADATTTPPEPRRPLFFGEPLPLLHANTLRRLIQQPELQQHGVLLPIHPFIQLLHQVQILLPEEILLISNMQQEIMQHQLMLHPD